MINLNDITLESMKLPNLQDVTLDVVANVAAGSSGYIPPSEDVSLTSLSNDDDDDTPQSDDTPPSEDDDSDDSDD